MAYESIFLLAEILRIEGYDRVTLKWWWFLLPIIALMVLLACWRLTVQLIQIWMRPRANPTGLFRLLAGVHRLNKAERALISKLKCTLPSGAPLALLFADPSCWAWKKITDPRTIEPLEKLYLKIFGFPRDQDET
jgi:hypothetical protein